MSDNPQSERDTNQASEELREQWSEQLEERLDDISTMGRTHMKREVMNLIRTEKLNLLSEVRERVIGQAKPDRRKATSWRQGIEVAAYEDAVRVYESKINEELAKLEAEL